MTSTRNADTAKAAFNGEYVATFTVPTKGAASIDGTPTTKRMIDTRNLSEEDLEALKIQDPFLHCSIPTVRKTALRCSAENADVRTQRNQEPARSRRASRPSQSQVESSSSAMVERKSCISFECHSDLLLEDLMLMDDAELFGNGDRFDLVAFDQLFLCFSGTNDSSCVTSLYYEPRVSKRSICNAPFLIMTVRVLLYGF